MIIKHTAISAARLLLVTGFVAGFGWGCTRTSAPEGASGAAASSAAGTPALHSVEMTPPSNGKATRSDRRVSGQDTAVGSV